MPENIPEMLERIKPTVANLFKKVTIIDDKIVDLTAARNKVASYTGVVNQTVTSQIEILNNLISKLSSISYRIKNELRNLARAMKKHNIIGGGSLDVDITELINLIDEYFVALKKLDEPNITDSELSQLDNTLKSLSYGVTDRLDDIDVRLSEMSGNGRKTKKSSKKSRKTRKTRKTNKKSRKYRKH